MSARSRELARRLTVLRLRCDAHRGLLGRELESVEARFASADRVAGVARDWLRSPAAVVLGAVALMAFGRGDGLRVLGRAWIVVSALRRLLQALARTAA
jgi:hypothetical protein